MHTFNYCFTCHHKSSKIWWFASLYGSYCSSNEDISQIYRQRLHKRLLDRIKSMLWIEGSWMWSQYITGRICSQDRITPKCEVTTIYTMTFDTNPLDRAYSFEHESTHDLGYQMPVIPSQFQSNGHSNIPQWQILFLLVFGFELIY